MKVHTYSCANGNTGLRDEGVSQGALPGVKALVGRVGPAGFQGTSYKGRKHWVERRLSLLVRKSAVFADDRVSGETQTIN